VTEECVWVKRLPRALKPHLEDVFAKIRGSVPTPIGDAMQFR